MTEESKRLTIIIGAIDKLSKPFKKISDRIEKLKAPVDKIKRSFNKLGKVAGLKKFNRGLRKTAKHAKAAAKSLGKAAKRAGLFAVVGGGAIIGLAKAYATAGDNIAKTALRLGIGVEALQEYRFAAIRSGVAQETFDMALQRFGRRAAEAANNTGEAKDALKALEVQLKDTAGNMRTVEDLLADALEQLGKVKDPLTRNALAMKLFDAEGVKMVQMTKEGAEGIKKLRKEAQELGFVMSAEAAASAEEFADKSHNLSKVLLGLRNRIGEKLLPVLTPMIDQLILLGKKYGPQVSLWADKFAKNLPEHLDKLWGGVKKLGKSLSTLGTVITWVSDNFGVMNAILGVSATVIGLQLVSAILSLAVAFKTLGLTFAMTPIGWIIVAIAGVIAGLVALYIYWDVIQKYAVQAITRIAEALRGLSEMIRGSVSKSLNFLVDGFKSVQSVFGGVAKVISNTLNFLIDGFKSVQSVFGGVAKFILSINPFSAILKSVNALIFALTGFDVLSAIGEKLQALLPNWALTLLNLKSVSAPVSAPISNSRTQVGGTMHIKIDSEGRPRVDELRSENPDVGVVVDVGMAMGSV